MNSKIKILLFFCMSLISCVCEDCTEPIVLEPFYVNNSGVTVRLTVGGYCEQEDNMIRCTQEIENNDTLCNLYLGYESCSNPYWFVTRDSENGGSYYEGGLGYITYFKIEFLTEPKVCLVFDGDDKVENDIRYWENYTLIRKRTKVHHYYSYTITPEHKARAREEDCQSSDRVKLLIRL
jgi:hypothetical protein